MDYNGLLSGRVRDNLPADMDLEEELDSLWDVVELVIGICRSLVRRLDYLERY